MGREHENTQNKMGVEPIGKLMLGMGLPMILSMMLQAVYNIVDSYFVSCMKDTAEISHMGDYAVNALTLAFPVQMLMVAVGVGTGVGINALLSKCLGQGNRKKASMIAGNAVFLGICTYVVFLLFGIFLVKPYLSSQTKDPVVLQMGTEYLQICAIMSFGIVLFMIYEKLLQATGRTVPAMVGQIAGAVTNMILDPIMIFGYFGCPAMGIKGAAYATIIGQILSCVLDGFFHYRLNREIDSNLKYLVPKKDIIKEIYQVGIPAIVMQALMSFMTYGVNIIFGTVSTAVVTAYGIFYKIQQFVLFAAFGMNNTLITLVAFNYGMKDKKRANDGIRYGMIDTLVIMAIGAVLLQVFAGQLSGMFALSAETKLLCVRAMRVVTVGFLFAGANIAFQGIFQALGCGVHSLIVSLLRLIVVTLPLAFLFTKLPNAAQNVWFAFPVAEAVALAAGVVMMRKIYSRKISGLTRKLAYE